VIKLTVVGKHLQCDHRNTCVSCSAYTWPPNLDPQNRYHHCEYCYIDILCHLGVGVSYEYKDDLIEKKVTCTKCGEKLIELVWPDPEK